MQPGLNLEFARSEGLGLEQALRAADEAGYRQVERGRWSGKGFADVGLDVSNGLWAEGFYADLIPSSEIALGNLKLAEDGSLQYGPQRYTAAVL